MDRLLGKDLETYKVTTTVAMKRSGKHSSTTRAAVGNGVMQPIARQLQHLDYNNGNGGVFYVVRAEELS
jgi:hypothetical protein